MFVHNAIEFLTVREGAFYCVSGPLGSHFPRYSRIPIYERERSNIVALLNVKQLTLLDASDHIPLRTVIEFYQNQLFYVFENTRLDYMFRAFREGNRGHMAFVQRVNDDGPGDPYYETIGIVTMEDVLEELLQAEIMDESDVGKVQARKPNSQRPKDAPYMFHKKLKSAVQIPPSLGLAAVQFLSASVEPFKKDHISVGIIQRLMKTTVVFVKAPKLKHNEKSPQFTYLYEKGKPSQYFTMILEGRVQVLVGSEKMTFEGGPFTCFGTDFLMSDQGYDVLKSLDPEHPEGTLLPEKKVVEYIPDYTVKALTDVTYFHLKYTAYKAAKLASELERNYKDPGNAAANSNWEAEIEKVLIEVEEE
ncbi:unnamed protein product [Allacma fusca]|uniref:CBS domain-containing protein n=1 Tax=Allacma fusca TaxID=39272 RepID=A0A8J2K6D0_9HEXA|nr:unnamed protein product [Allacma fusca]